MGVEKEVAVDLREMTSDPAERDRVTKRDKPKIRIRYYAGEL